MGMKSTATKNKWNAENYERISLSVKKGSKKPLQEAAKECGESINGYIKNAIQSRYKADTGEDIEL
ncbi:MAG: hypothetical protein ACI4JS_10845 [Oscillospiraceae bacterium]